MKMIVGMLYLLQILVKYPSMTRLITQINLGDVKSGWQLSHAQLTFMSSKQMKLMEEGVIWLMSYNFMGVFVCFQISEEYLMKFKISGDYLTFHSFEYILRNHYNNEIKIS
jgi:hypothetical protein